MNDYFQVSTIQGLVMRLFYLWFRGTFIVLLQSEFLVGIELHELNKFVHGWCNVLRLHHQHITSTVTNGGKKSTIKKLIWTIFIWFGSINIANSEKNMEVTKHTQNRLLRRGLFFVVDSKLWSKWLDLIPEPSTSKVTSRTSWKWVAGVTLLLDTKRAKKGCSRVGMTVSVFATDDDIMVTSSLAGDTTSISSTKFTLYLEGNLL